MVSSGFLSLSRAKAKARARASPQPFWGSRCVTVSVRSGCLGAHCQPCVLPPTTWSAPFLPVSASVIVFRGPSVPATPCHRGQWTQRRIFLESPRSTSGRALPGKPPEVREPEQSLECSCWECPRRQVLHLNSDGRGTQGRWVWARASTSGLGEELWLQLRGRLLVSWLKVGQGRESVRRA